jgi:HlyD family secretion protein
MKKKWPKVPLSILLAIAGILFSAYYIFNSNKVEPRPRPLRPPASKDLDTALVGTGLVESARENVAVMPYRTGKVLRVLVREGDKVTEGQPLYTLDMAQERARLATMQANIASQRAVLNQLLHQPRPEDLPPLRAQVAQAEANYQDQLTQLKRVEGVSLPGAVSADELSRHRYATAAAKAQLEQAKKQLARTQAGAWTYDIQKARADIQAMVAQTGEQQVLVNQSVVKAPRTGTVLKVNIRPGEAVNAATSGTSSNTAPMLIGETDQLQIRVDIDEVNANRVKPNMPAMAILRGNAQQRFRLVFDRVIPYMVPKTQLSGAASERVDVRVLQLIYTFTPPDFPVYVGQQVDVYLFDPGKTVNWSALLHPKLPPRGVPTMTNEPLPQAPDGDKPR